MNEFTRKAMELAEKMMRDSWATGDDAAWHPARSALLAHLEGGEQKWLPIETAPRDGTRVLTYRAGFAESQAVAWFNHTGCGDPCWVPVHGSSWPEPTHWCQLPATPTEAETK
jgi:hypothetical protein